MRTMLVVLMALMISGIAIAEKPVHGPTAYVHEGFGSRAVGDDCSDPIIVTLPAALPYSDANTTCGRGNFHADTCLGSYDGGEEIVYQLDVTVDGYYDIFLTSDSTWTGLMVTDDCLGATCVDFVTGSSANKELTGLFLAAGTYFVMADTWPSPACINAMTLDIVAGTPPPPPPANDLCADAEIIPAGAFSIDGDTTDAIHDYDPGSGGCTGYGAAGHDVVYVICLAPDSFFDVTMTAGFDDSIYLVLDCADPAGTCVAGSDLYPSGSNFSYQNLSGDAQQLYLIVDGYGASNNGAFNITGNNDGGCDPVGNESMNWGSIKSLYQ